MINRIIRVVIAVLGALLGVALFVYTTSVFALEGIKGNFATYIIGIIISSFLSGLLLFMLSPWLINKGRGLANWIERELANVPVINIVLGSIGLTFGLIIAYLVSGLLNNFPIPFVGEIISAALYIFMAYLGVSIATKKIDELTNLQAIFKKNSQKEKSGKKEGKVLPKILDTSVIIDGRIADICKTGFVEGPLIIPSFVLEELRHIADSSDSLKRNRGRRGLDILNKIQKELDIEVRIFEKDFEDLSEVDTKLLKLAQVLDGKVLTNDFNLNKVAEFQGVPVLNINELANAVKPIVLPGEEMIVQVIKDGKESGQGLAYLDDGTMIVVDSGKKFIGKNIDVLVTSVLQTAAGRMIFAKPKSLMDKSAS
ncbi:PIN/TRAM domain-containing protein [Alkaliphilus serpentinus]|uniref:PIN/TRAM domain-containing protein n=1 Tax=Alkaliphilus serpentinus TaxID=1482731 RepID=A0A833HQT5_9FIRM|nr:PIN/TRAM domain-containing protein [Alkaliphilus serpentinus]KAB3532405.1 PIN/TRAM domain-containing protein [Alkaliphilus serpentinus]